MVDMIDLTELQLESHDGVDCKDVELGIIFVMILSLAKIEF